MSTDARPLILFSNDDGIHSPYLEPLANAVAQTLGADTLVIAPERERSAMSHTITLHKPLRARELAPGWMMVSGTPVDCVYLGLTRLCSRPPALVISGINQGYNLGTDIYYSGTVGAAMEAGLKGTAAIAASLDPLAKAEDLAKTVELVVHLAQAVLADRDARGRVFNLNVPAGWKGGYTWTRLGSRTYREDVAERLDPRGRPYLWIGGGVAGIDETAGTDTEAVYRRGLASITPLEVDRTGRTLLQEADARWPIAKFELAPRS
jgi:5'-nucleotidase